MVISGWWPHASMCFYASRLNYTFFEIYQSSTNIKFQFNFLFVKIAFLCVNTLVTHFHDGLCSLLKLALTFCCDRNCWYFHAVIQICHQLTEVFLKTTYLHSVPAAVDSDWQLHIRLLPQSGAGGSFWQGGACGSSWQGGAGGSSGQGEACGS